MDHTDNVYDRLRRHLDEMPVPFPATKSGVELRLLRRLFSPEEAEIALALGAGASPSSTVARRLKRRGVVVAGLEEKLDGMVARGSIAGGRRRNRGGVAKVYGKAPLAVGMFEFQVDHLTEGLVRDFEAYMDEGFRDALLGERATPQMRPVPIDVEVVQDGRIARYDDVRSYVAGHEGPFGVMNCVCRQAKDVTGGSCRHGDLRETCLMIGGAALSMEGLGHARLVDKSVFLSFLDRARDQGLVLQPQNTRAPGFICCCCADCCELLVNARKLPRPAEVLGSGYIARIEENRCVGCGLCATVCAAGALELAVTFVKPAPPRGANALYLRMMIERFGPLRALGKAARILLGIKV